MRATVQLLFWFCIMFGSAPAATVTNTFASISGLCSAADTRSGATFATAMATCSFDVFTATALGNASIAENPNPAAFEVVLNASGSGNAFGIGSAFASGDAEYSAELVVLGGPATGEVMVNVSYGGSGGTFGRVRLHGSTLYEEDSPLNPFSAVIPFAYGRGVPFGVSLFARAAGGEPQGLGPDPGDALLRVVLNASEGSITIVPEPGTVALTIIGSLLLVWKRLANRRVRIAERIRNTAGEP